MSLRHRMMIFSLARFHSHMSESEEKEICRHLDSLTAQKPPSGESDETGGRLDILHVTSHDGVVLPPMNFYTIPTLKFVS